ncbi:hypothetical protein V6N13_106872 [Hibiscus sabdariffa]
MYHSTPILEEFGVNLDDANEMDEDETDLENAGVRVPQTTSERPYLALKLMKINQRKSFCLLFRKSGEEQRMECLEHWTRIMEGRSN